MRDPEDKKPSPDELAAAARLREALESAAEGESPPAATEDADLARALRAAWAPGPLGAEDLDALVREATDPAEVANAASLRSALESDDGTPDGTGELARALHAAWAPAAVDAETHQAIVARALDAMPAAPRAAGDVVDLATRRRAVATRVALGAVSALALAASLFVYVSRTSPAEELPLARARSTQPLFPEPFKAGEASARIDRIALARESDYRANRFAKWGVR